MTPPRIVRRFLTLAGLFVSTSAWAAPTNPPAGVPAGGPPSPPAPGVVRAVVVRSWGTSLDGLAWEHLNQHWDLYGSVPVFIDYSSLHEVSAITLQDLENSGADVVIVSDPAGGNMQWTPQEVAALDAYARQGHNLLGTYLLLYWEYVPTDDRILAPLWGLRSDFAYGSGYTQADPWAALLAPEHCSFVGVSGALDMGGWPYVQVPADLSWDASDLAGAHFLARSLNGRNVVTEYDGGSYRAFFISYMPEYQDGSHYESTQWLYDALVCGSAVTAAANPTWGRIKALYRN